MNYYYRGTSEMTTFGNVNEINPSVKKIQGLNQLFTTFLRIAMQSLIYHSSGYLIQYQYELV
ncbi:hypothetical protein GCM10009122_39120 [Fulvivirga kasyanovii]